LGFYQSSPTMAGDIVHVGSNDGNVYGLDARTGALVWRFATQGRVASSPAVAGGVVAAHAVRDHPGGRGKTACGVRRGPQARRPPRVARP
jgi:outer membrane protein assembly factor BamB